MPEAYFNPWRADQGGDCRTCRYSTGQPDGTHLWCSHHRLVVVFPCGWWEREARADQKQESLHSVDFTRTLVLNAIVAALFERRANVRPSASGMDLNADPIRRRNTTQDTSHPMVREAPPGGRVPVRVEGREAGADSEEENRFY